MKQYKRETLYLAVSLADRYLVYAAFSKKEPPCLVTLAVTCVLLAAKLEEPISPSFTRMINLLAEQQQTILEKQALIDLEEQIIKMLDFSVRTVSPCHFLERYLRLFGIDGKKQDKNARQVANLARNYCKFMQREAPFLAYKPSATAAASLVLAINISQSEVAPSIGVKRIPELKMQSLLHDTLTIHAELSAGLLDEQDTTSPLRIWNPAVEKLTLLKREANIRPVYRALIENLNESVYKQKLFED